LKRKKVTILIKKIRHILAKREERSIIRKEIYKTYGNKA